MATTGSVTVNGVEAMLRNLGKYGEGARKLAAAALYQEGLVIMADSKDNFVPVDQGVLKSTGHVDAPVTKGSTTSVTLGYGGPAAPYALAIHENPRAGKTGGVSPSGKPYKHWATVGGWKYLETPFMNAAKDLAARLAARLSRISVK